MHLSHRGYSAYASIKPNMSFYHFARKPLFHTQSIFALFITLGAKFLLQPCIRGRKHTCAHTLTHYCTSSGFSEGPWRDSEENADHASLPASLLLARPLHCSPVALQQFCLRAGSPARLHALSLQTRKHRIMSMHPSCMFLHISQVQEFAVHGETLISYRQEYAGCE